MSPRRSLPAALAAVLFALSCAPSPSPEPQSGSESHFLEACVGQCSAGLSCLCGVCTASCDAERGCARFDTASSCIALSDRGAASACAAEPSGGVCDVPCAASSECGTLGPSFFCLGGFCRVDPLYRPLEPMPGFGALCEQAGLSCSTLENPPTLLGSYSGQGTVVLSSNALWAVSQSETLSVQITQQDNGVIAGGIDLPSLSLSITGAAVRGDAGAFSLYASGSAQVMACSAEARALISGVLDDSAVPATVSGAMVLRFTGNFAATGCTPSQMASYPATGANFRHSEARLP